MSNLKVYLETSYISWLVARLSTDPDKAVKQAWTRKWWEERHEQCDLYGSEYLVRESLDGDADQVARRMDVVRTLNLLDGSISEVKTLAQALLSGKAVPPNEVTDAHHIATAAVYGMDVLLTWNCKHLANLVTLPKTASIIARAGYLCPKIVTPQVILEAEDEAE